MTIPAAQERMESAIQSTAAVGPLIRPLATSWTPEFCFERLSALPGCVWLDSSALLKDVGRYSYMAACPIARLRVDKTSRTSLVLLDQYCQKYYQPRQADLPPMQGGWLGWFGYELGGCFENVPTARYNDFCLPVASLGFYDVVLCWDHDRNEGWLISQGWPAAGSARLKKAYERLKYFLSILEQSPPDSEPLIRATSKRQIVPQHATRWSPEWTSNFSPEQYRAAVQKCVDYIYAGDVFQVNLSQRLLRKATCSPASLYRVLREQTAAPFAGYADLGRAVVVSTSPERFLQVSDGVIESRPIKGTRPRLSDPTADNAMGEVLRNSAKDRSENIMIVDLLRNDLSRVSTFDSVSVPRLCELEKFSHVWHLVSTIQATLRQGLAASDILEATFPGGSITGAPKIRAMEIIAELEPTVRGPYCGSLGYVSTSGDIDLNILIRTVTACNGWWQVPVGGGIVADSDPTLEEQETWHKAEGILRSIDRLG